MRASRVREGRDVGATPVGQDRALLRLLSDVSREREALRAERSAVLNILEDVSESREALSRAGSEALNLVRLTLELSASLNVFDTMRRIVEAMRGIAPRATIAYVLGTSVACSGRAFVTYVHSPDVVGDRYTSLLQREIKNLVDSQAAVRGGKASDASGDLRVQYVIDEGSYDADCMYAPSEVATFTVMTSESEVGAMFVSPCRGWLEPAAVQSLRDVAELAGLTIVRLTALLAAEQSVLIDLIGTLSEGVLLFGMDRRVVVANAVFEAATGIGLRDDVVESTLAESLDRGEWVTLGTQRDLRSIVEDALIRGKTTHMGEVVFSDRVFDVVIRAVRGSRGAISGGVVLMQDLTRARAAVLEKARHALLSTVSHELRTPLTSILDGVSLVLDGTAGEINEDQRRFLSLAGRNVGRLARLIDDLLDMSRMEAGKMNMARESVDLRLLAAGVVESFQLQAQGKQIGLRQDFPAGDWVIHADPDRVTQVIANLVSNALKFTSDGQIDVVGADKGDYVEISVKDTGFGIPIDKVETVFDEFERVDETTEPGRGGTGLGLAICRSIVQAHGGFLGATSERGKGSTFTFSLPRGLREADAYGAAEAPPR